jgi:cysteine-S-conjugate beta-lyase
MNQAKHSNYARETLVTLLGRNPEMHAGSVSPPVERTSTRVFSTLAELEKAHSTGKLSDFLGSTTPEWLEEAVAELEGGDSQVIASGTGMASLAIVFLSVLETGDHILVPDSVFWPTRKVVDGLMRRIGIEADYYDPMAGAAIKDELRPNTKLVLTESPGSNTFEVQDIPAITEAAHAAGALVATDNSWATPLLFRPLEHGVDFSMCAVTKYLVGHSDVLMGTVATRPEHIQRLRETANQLGNSCAPDDAFMALRGLRTLAIRMRHFEEAGLRIAKWLDKRPEVKRVLHPALPSCPGHEIWKRDFDGSSGLFSIVVEKLSRAQLERFLESLQLFKLGYSWGGFESLILPVYPQNERSVTHWKDDGTVIRVNVGLENPDDLEADLDSAFRRLQEQKR